MVLLLLGVVLFAGVHLIPSLAPSLRASWYGRMGEGGYKATFSLLLLASFALMIMGWRSAQPTFVYLPWASLRHPAMGLLLIAFLLMVVSARSSRLCRLIRHPQLTGVTLWGFAHLLLNGDSRSLLLFGSMATWSIVEMIAINKREGAWIKRKAPSWGSEIISLVIAVLMVGIIVFIHPWISGMPIT